MRILIAFGVAILATAVGLIGYLGYWGYYRNLNGISLPRLPNWLLRILPGPRSWR